MSSATDLQQIPVVDIAPLLRHDPSGATRVAQQIGDACRGIGFFYIVGHGIPEETRTRVFETARRFFAMPASFKDASGFTGPGSNRGFIRFGDETLDPGKPADLKEAFNIGLELAADDPDLGQPFRARNLWPEVAGFRAIMLDYFDGLWRLGRDLHRAFALDLGLDPWFFEDKFRKPMATLRLLHYPPMDMPPVSDQMGAGVHTDYGNVTLLATDAVGGLKVRDRSGRWLDAPVVPGAFVCNIGDCLMRWTNDTYVSTPHKVVTPPGRDRYSVAFFLDPDPDAMVESLPTCVSVERPAKYQRISAADFLKSRLEPTYAKA